MENQNEIIELIRYFGYRRTRARGEEGWCLDKKMHLYRSYVDMGEVCSAGYPVTLRMAYIGPCDGRLCKEFTTTDLREVRREPMVPEGILRVKLGNVPPEFREYMQRKYLKPEEIPEYLERYLR